MLIVVTATVTSGYQRTLGACVFMASDYIAAFDTFGGVKVGWRGRAVGWVAYSRARLLIARCVGGA